MKIRSFIALLFPIFLLTGAAAQNGMFGISYNTALPLGETGDFVDAYSWRGVSLEARWLTTPNVSAGFFAGWNVFYEKERGDFFDVDDTRAASGTQLRTLNALPLLLTGHYYFGQEYASRPYLGLGIGAYRTLQQTTLGIYAVEKRNWQFGLAPSVGWLLPLGSDQALMNLEVRYNYAFKSGDAIDHSYLGINLGFAWAN